MSTGAVGQVDGGRLDWRASVGLVGHDNQLLLWDRTREIWSPLPHDHPAHPVDAQTSGSGTGS